MSEEFDEDAIFCCICDTFVVRDAQHTKILPTLHVQKLSMKSHSVKVPIPSIVSQFFTLEEVKEDVIAVRTTNRV